MTDENVRHLVAGGDVRIKVADVLKDATALYVHQTLEALAEMGAQTTSEVQTDYMAGESEFQVRITLKGSQMVGLDVYSRKGKEYTRLSDGRPIYSGSD